MMVAFPTPEPWPAETFADYGIAELQALIEGANAAILERRSAARSADPHACHDCTEYVHPSDSTCAACGAPQSLFRNQTGPARDHLGVEGEQGQEVPMVVVDCECGTCARCSLRSYEPDIKVQNAVHDSLEAALARPGNVAELRRWSVKA